MTIEWTPSALENLRDIHSDTAAISSPAAEAILGKVLDEIDRLSSTPLIGREGRVEDTRELPLLDMPLGCFIPNFRQGNSNPCDSSGSSSTSFMKLNGLTD